MNNYMAYGSHLCLWQKYKQTFAFKRFNSTIILETFATNSLNASQTIKQLCQLVLNLLLRQDPRTNCTTNLFIKTLPNKESFSHSSDSDVTIFVVQRPNPN